MNVCMNIYTTVGIMGNPACSPSIMMGVKNEGLRYYVADVIITKDLKLKMDKLMTGDVVWKLLELTIHHFY